MTTATDKFLYEVRSNPAGLSIKVGIYDPNRWSRADEGERGGIAFGLDAEVWVSERWNGNMETVLSAEVSQGSIGMTSVATALQRLEVYTQAVMMAQFINDQLAAGESLAKIGDDFKNELATDPQAPASEPFRYGAL